MGKIMSTSYLTDTVNGIRIDSSIPSASGNYASYSSRDIKYIVMHYTGNSSDTAKNNAAYFNLAARNAGAHFFVDNNNIYQSVKLKDAAWHCGTGGTYYSACRNVSSIGIEMCTSGSYLVSDTTKKNAAFLCAHLCDLIGITASAVDTYVLTHYDVTHKNCPAQMVADPKEWTEFKEIVKHILSGSASTSAGAQTPSAMAQAQPAASQTASASYPQTALITDVISTLGIAASASLSTVLNKTVTISTATNKKHALVKPIQRYLQALGYYTGLIDGDFGALSKAAIIRYQKEIVKAAPANCDGVITAKAATWRKLLGIN